MEHKPDYAMQIAKEIEARHAAEMAAWEEEQLAELDAEQPSHQE